jgi:hypothetical protein
VGTIVIAVVTGFVPIPEHPRSEAEYRKLGKRLMTAQVPQGEATCMQLEMKLTDCWLYQWLEWRGQDFTHSVSDNPKKNTPAYHIVQAQKSEMLMEAARASNPNIDVFCWIDYGIYHLTGMNDQVLVEFLRRAKDEQTVTIPGCWNRDYTYTDEHPCWRFCGGVMIVPRRYVFEFDLAMKQEYIDGLYRTNKLVWEVNVLSRLERNGFPIFHYAADHDVSMFTEYKGVASAC